MMVFKELPLKDALIIISDVFYDNRGTFIRNFDYDKFRTETLHNFNVKQISISNNLNMLTLRGMHYQNVPYRESKIVGCISGKIYDVIVDLRKKSETYEKWYGIILKQNELLYIPKGFAHGYVTLENNTIVIYYMDVSYNAAYSKGFKWNSSKYNIDWMYDRLFTDKTHNDLILSDRDNSLPFINEYDCIHVD